jgi:hypothetical protein
VISTSSEQEDPPRPDEPEAPAPGFGAHAALSDVVKSRILDRVLRDLSEDRPLGLRSGGYTRSDSGVYGKYEKQDVDAAAVSDLVRLEVERILAEYDELPPS